MPQKIKGTIAAIIIIFSITICGAALYANSHIPENALKTFLHQYPHVNKYKSVVREDTCVVHFKMDKRKCSAFYLINGEWLKTEEDIPVPWKWHLPKAVENAWNHSAFSSWYVDNVKQIDYPERKIFIIQVHLELGPPESIPGDWMEIAILYFDENGNITKTEDWRTF